MCVLHSGRISLSYKIKSPFNLIATQDLAVHIPEWIVLITKVPMYDPKLCMNVCCNGDEKENKNQTWSSL